MFIIVLALGEDKIAAISAKGAMAFIVLAMPTDISAQRRNTIDAHLVGLVSGMIFYFAPLLFDVFVAIMADAEILSQYRYYLRHHLKDLV